MNAHPTRFAKSGSRERPSFRPVLETLEDRIAPTSAAQASAAFDQLPTDMNNLLTSMAARPVDASTVNTNLGAVINDVALLQTGASQFVVADRLQIDDALYTDGFLLLYNSFADYPFIPPPQSFYVFQVGCEAMLAASSDLVLTGLFPQTSGDSTLS